MSGLTNPIPPAEALVLRSRAWKMLADGRALTRRQLERAVGAGAYGLETAIANWQRRGYLVRLPGRPAVYQRAEGAPEQMPVPAWARQRVLQTPRARIWSTIRILKNFDLPTLAFASEMPIERCQQLVNQLVCSGFLAVAAPYDPVTRDGERYRLIRPSGPLPPTYRQRLEDGRFAKTMFDRNDGKSYPVRPRFDFGPSNGGGVG